MMTLSRSPGLSPRALVWAVPMLAVSTPVAGQSLGDALVDGRWFADARLRHESVRDEGFTREAAATTFGVRLGYETGQFHDLHLLFEGEAVGDIGGERFDDTVNGRTAFPVVADPDAIELNQGYVHYQPRADLFVRAGRQRIVLDNHRFIGNVGFRQNEQTYDAVTAGFAGPWESDIGIGYIFNVNTFFGNESPIGDRRSKSIYAHADGTLFGGTLTAYTYLIDLADGAAVSSATIGGRYSGSYQFRFNRDLSVLYTAEYAEQWDYGGNPGDFLLSYWLVEPGFRLEAFTARLGLETLSGDGTNAVQTPLATAHAFNGITDIFVITPPDGLRDLYGKIALDFGAAGMLDDTVFKAAFHRFWAEEGGKTYGSEFSVTLTKAFRDISPLIDSFAIEVEYASYHADTFGRDTDKLWLTGRLKL